MSMIFITLLIMLIPFLNKLKSTIDVGIDFSEFHGTEVDSIFSIKNAYKTVYAI